MCFSMVTKSPTIAVRERGNEKCVRMCVFLYSANIESQNIHSTGKVRTLFGSEHNLRKIEIFISVYIIKDTSSVVSEV